MTKDPIKLTAEEKQIKAGFEKLGQNEPAGPSFTERTPAPSPFPVYCCGRNSTNKFKQARQSDYPPLFCQKPMAETVINYTPNEVRSALSSLTSRVAVSMTQESHLPQEDDVDDYGNDTDDGAPTTCINFSDRVRATVDELQNSNEAIADCYYKMLMPQFKEMVTLMSAAGSSSDECAKCILSMFSDVITERKAALNSRKPAPTGQVISACPIGKHKKTTASGYVSSLGHS